MGRMLTWQPTYQAVAVVHADETIITWTDPDIGTDVALSFQEGQGCNAIWYAVGLLLHWDCGMRRACS